MTTTIKKLSAMPYAQAHVEINEHGDICLFSYVTLVAWIDRNGWCGCTGTYSQPTRKHISAFAKEYAAPLDYYSFKGAYEGGYVMNRHTGEVLDYGDYAHLGE
jgi:hypothetical protein